MRSQMRLLLAGLLWIVLLGANSSAATKVHVIAFGKSISTQWIAAATAESEKPQSMKVCALIVDGRTKEYFVGSAHDITDRLFVVRRAFRVNDSLPEDLTPRWQWQRGGWLIVDRLTGRISAITLPEFDSLYSTVSWYRDYVAYCGIADDGKKINAVVSQIGRRKPIVRKLLSSNGLQDDAAADSACSVPIWQRNPIRVSFEAAGAPRQTFSIRGQVVDVVNDAEDDEDSK
jgi:hypothetical protein